MKIKDFMEQLYTVSDPGGDHYQKTCDVLKVGNPDAEVTKVATAMMGTPQVIRDAAKWGANLLIVHEPLFYDHWDDLSNLETFPEPKKSLIKAKIQLIRDSGLTIYRFHDHPHYRKEDMISLGEIKYWGLKGTWSQGTRFASNRFTLDEPMTVKDIVSTIEKNLNIRHIRIAGAEDAICRKLALDFGTPGGLESDLAECDAVFTGEICEWMQGEFVRDYADLIEKKAVIVMGHVGSERDGMRLLVDFIQEQHPSLEVRYFECGEVYQYSH